MSPRRVWDRHKIAVTYCTVICTGVVIYTLWHLVTKVGL